MRISVFRGFGVVVVCWIDMVVASNWGARGCRVVRSLSLVVGYEAPNESLRLLLRRILVLPSATTQNLDRAVVHIPVCLMPPVVFVAIFEPSEEYNNEEGEDSDTR